MEPVIAGACIIGIFSILSALSIRTSPLLSLTLPKDGVRISSNTVLSPGHVPPGMRTAVLLEVEDRQEDNEKKEEEEDKEKKMRRNLKRNKGMRGGASGKRKALKGFHN
ncbi:hypothetical protein JKP88DRAFT_339606 [Tribonema minus]|uniref:Uncharacterized protein n=1 Tax=Tribonema minus TaxID=303371 RepID=A0A835YIG0_9STRA|nr:hypothetical protein JKP88DRAFT_339606 [Tribonema minus]